MGKERCLRKERRETVAGDQIQSVSALMLSACQLSGGSATTQSSPRIRRNARRGTHISWFMGHILSLFYGVILFGKTKSFALPENEEDRRKAPS